MKIETFDFDTNGLDALKKYPKGCDWPVVYLINDSKRLYIGETTSAYTRMSQHLKNPLKNGLLKINIIFDDLFNKSVVLDYEQKIIKYSNVDKTFPIIMNGNNGQLETHEYYDRAIYEKRFEELWNQLIAHKLATKKTSVLENENMFKFSPYTKLNYEQKETRNAIVNQLCDMLEKDREGLTLVEGCAGTGKTVLAISLIYMIVKAKNIDFSSYSPDELKDGLLESAKRLQEWIVKNHPLKIGFVIPMTGIRSIIYDVFQNSGDGLSKSMVLNPNEITNEKYDILVVDESHRLRGCKNLGQYSNNYRKSCKKLGMIEGEANQLDFILKQSKFTVLFYDELQSITNSDIGDLAFRNSIANSRKQKYNLSLTSQMRCHGGVDYIDYVRNIFNCNADKFLEIKNYDFKIFDDVDVMIKKIREYDDKLGLSKTVAGYSWKWVTKPKLDPADTLVKYSALVRNGRYDIEIGPYKYIWNLVTKKWIERKDSKYTIGCIHTTQGLDLNYVGVIFGREIDYNRDKNEITVNKDFFYDQKVKIHTDDATFKKFIINTYTTMMARGIKGCYVYAYNEGLRNYLKNFIKKG